jgi:hypothetical protein
MQNPPGEEGDEQDEYAVAPPCPNGLFNFPSGSTVVQDADEEVSWLPRSSRRG